MSYVCLDINYEVGIYPVRPWEYNARSVNAAATKSVQAEREGINAMPDIMKPNSSGWS